MGKHCSKWRGPACALVTSGIALAFLAQMLAFVFSPSGRLAFSNGDADASIAMAGEICHASSDDAGKAPAQPARHQHCALCSIGNHAHELDPVVLVASIVIVPAPGSGDGNARGWSLFDNLLSLPIGWTSSWSSRAPPPIG